MNTCVACGHQICPDSHESYCDLCVTIAKLWSLCRKRLRQNPAIVLAECPHLCGCNRALKDGDTLKCWGCGVEWSVSSKKD